MHNRPDPGLIIVLGPDVSDWNDWRVRAADLPAGHSLENESCFATLSPNSALVIAARREGRPAEPQPTCNVAISQNSTLCRSVYRHLLSTVDTLTGGVHANV